jgi:predicted  nucleic acid-binding Zn-ribbon protein
MDHWEEKYNDLKYEYDRRGRRIEELTQEVKGLEDRLYSAEYKIRTELEPRIESEKRGYDAYITDTERRH